MVDNRGGLLYYRSLPLDFVSGFPKDHGHALGCQQNAVASTGEEEQFNDFVGSCGVDIAMA